MEKLMALVDEHKDTMTDGDYLEMCNELKRLYDLDKTHHTHPEQLQGGNIQEGYRELLERARVLEAQQDALEEQAQLEADEQNRRGERLQIYPDVLPSSVDFMVDRTTAYPTLNTDFLMGTGSQPYPTLPFN